MQASLVEDANDAAIKVLVAPEFEQVPRDFVFECGKATERVPPLVAQWLDTGR